MIVVVETDVVYNFIFKGTFNNFDNIYRVHQIMSWDEFAKLNIDMYKMIYSPIDKTIDDYKLEIPTLRKSAIYKLSSPDITLQHKPDDTDQFLYVSKDFLSASPDPNVKNYNHIVLAARLGPLDNIENLNFVKGTIKEVISSATGIIPDIKISSIRSTWLTENEYSILEGLRANDAKKVINYFSECIKLRTELDRVNEELLAYKNTLIESKK